MYHMRKILHTAGCLALCIGLALSLSATTCDTATSQDPGKELSAKKKFKFAVQPDTTVCRLLGDKAANTLFTAKKATLYRLNPSVRPTDQDVTIGGVKVEEKLCGLDKQDIYLFQFLLADSLTYSNDPLVPLTPFAPTAAIEFSGKQGTCFLLFSLTSQEVGIVIDGKRVFTSRYRNARTLTRWFAIQLNDEFYNNLLKMLK